MLKASVAKDPVIPFQQVLRYKNKNSIKRNMALTEEQKAKIVSFHALKVLLDGTTDIIA